MGSVSLGGIGCHVLAPEIFPESNRTVAQMGELLGRAGHRFDTGIE